LLLLALFLSVRLLVFHSFCIICTLTHRQSISRSLSRATLGHTLGHNMFPTTPIKLLGSQSYLKLGDARFGFQFFSFHSIVL